MKYRYHIDPADYTLDYLEQNLLSRELIPSRQPLKDGLNEKMEILKELGIDTLDELLIYLKSKKKLETLAVLSGLSIEYLTLLRREVNSYLPNPVPLSKFPGVSSRDISKLAQHGIKNSRHLFEKAGLVGGRKGLSGSTGISEESLQELVGLSDLVRAYGVGPVFARILYDTGIHSIEELKSHSAEEIIRLYEDKFQQKADFSLRDMNFSLDIARALDIGVDL